MVRRNQNAGSRFSQQDEQPEAEEFENAPGARAQRAETDRLDESGAPVIEDEGPAEDLVERVRQRAYQGFCERGTCLVTAEGDWVDAENDVRRTAHGKGE